MTFTLKPLFFSLILLLASDSGNLKTVADIDKDLSESSAIEIVSTSNLYWTIEDSGNDNTLYGLNEKGKIIKAIEIENSKNKDWEDLASDTNGNIYIGDFGNNSKKRKNFTIYKVAITNDLNEEATAERLHFKLPKKMKSENFEAFYHYNNSLFIISKTKSKAKVFKINDSSENQIAELVSSHKLDGKNNLITAADINETGQSIVLLNHDKVWKLSNYNNEDIFSGTIESYNFDHDSQKEGVVFKNSSTLLITDEHNKKDGKIYQYTFKDSK
ncbi:hypothetical protein [Lacinutrix salivirga]